MSEPLLASVLRRLHLAMRKRVYEDVQRAGFTDLAPAHLYVFQLPGPDGARPTDLAARTNMTKQAMNHLLSFLEREGYLTRQADGEDGRARVVRLTDRGRALEEAMRLSAARVELEWTEQVGSRRMAALRRAVVALDAAVTDASLRG